MKIQHLLLFALLAAVACKKDPGYGGNTTIEGTVWVRDYNATFTQLIGEYPGKDIYVYIVYGDNTGYNKRIKTDYNGKFSFPFLYEGDYTVYTYSLDSTFTDLSGLVPVVQKVQLSGKKETKQLEPFIILQ